jgi:hypothetical protein
MAFPIRFNYGSPVVYAISGNITGQKMVEAWNILTGSGED